MDQQQVQKDQVIWHETGVPMSSMFEDPYFSLKDGLAETRHVFIDGSDLPARFANGFHVAELGFGTGLNALATLQAWETARLPGSFRFTSFEAYPMPAADMKQSLSRWPELKQYASDLLEAWADGKRRINVRAMELAIIEGDVRETLPDWDGRADAWYLDGFSPSKNPEMWKAEVMNGVFAHTRQGGTFATYTSASRIRAALQDAGFSVERIKGFAHKRHMTVGRK